MTRLQAWIPVLILLSLWALMLLTGGPYSRYDTSLLPVFRAPDLVGIARFFTWLGNWRVLLPLTLVAAAALFFLVSRRAGLVYLLLIFGGRLLVEGEKTAFGRARPDEHGRLAEVVSLSYPSGHAAYSMIAWLGLALLAARTPRQRAAAAAFALALSFATGLSRLVLQVHWPSDVIGGWAFGAAWTLLLVRLADGTAGRAPH